MTPSHETRFLDAVRVALGKKKKAPLFTDLLGPLSTHRDRQNKTTAQRSKAEQAALLETFTRQAEKIHCRVLAVENTRQAARAVKDLARTLDPEWGDEKCVAAWHHPLLASLDLEKELARDGIPVFTAPRRRDPALRETFRDQVVRSYIGITSADVCVADTATLVMEERSGRPRSVSLIPSVHIAVIPVRCILKDLSELYSYLGRKDHGPDRCLTFVSGPSKTADIELHMVLGAHGPRQVAVIVITG